MIEEKTPRVIIADEYDAQKIVQANGYAKAIGATLRKHYPGRNWYVDVNMDGGVATVKCCDISMDWGYVLHLTQTTDELTRKSISRR